MAAAVNRPPALSTLVATAPRARKIGLSSMIRVNSMVRASSASPNPGVMTGTMTGARMNNPMARIARPISMRLITVDTTRQARADSLVVNRAETIGISAEESAPAATSWKMRSGKRNAAKNASSSGPAGNVLPITTRRTYPSSRDTRNAPDTISPARAMRLWTAHGAGSRRARGWASRYAVRRRVGDTWV